MAFGARSGRQLWQRHNPFRYGQMEAYVLFDRDGTLITTAPRGNTLMWNVRSGKIVRRFPIGGRPGISADGHTLALAINSWHAIDPSAAVALLDLRTGGVRHFKGNLPTEWIYSLGFSRDGRQIVGPSWGGVHIWGIASGEVVDTYAAEGDAAGGNLGRRQPDRLGSSGHAVGRTQDACGRRILSHRYLLGHRRADFGGRSRPQGRDDRAARSAQRATDREPARA
jgi:WD40 repeat protein